MVLLKNGVAKKLGVSMKRGGKIAGYFGGWSMKKIESRNTEYRRKSCEFILGNRFIERYREPLWMINPQVDTSSLGPRNYSIPLPSRNNNRDGIKERFPNEQKPSIATRRCEASRPIMH
jgi:hypothetical protein